MSCGIVASLLNTIILYNFLITQSLHPTHLPIKKSTMKLYFTSLKNEQHVRQSQYMLQIIKCSDSFCGKPWRTNYPMFFPKQFLPVPVTISTSDNGLKIDPKKGSFRSLFHFFYLASTLRLDTCCSEYCPSLQEKNAKNEGVIDWHTCKNCSLYHSTVAAMKKLKSVCQNKQMTN